jgi:hypothetical protein
MHDGRKAHRGVCTAGYALQADRRVNGCVRTGRFGPHQELLRQIAVPIEESISPLEIGRGCPT